MLIYELVQTELSEDMTDRDLSPTPTIPTAPEVNDMDEIPEAVTEETEPKSIESQLNVPDEHKDPRSLLNLIESHLEETHISPPSSVVSHFTDDDFPEGQKSTRSTSFSSVHSRPTTPLFETKDPQISPPPLKRVRQDAWQEDGELAFER